MFSCYVAQFWLVTHCYLNLHSQLNSGLGLASVCSTAVTDSTEALQVGEEIFSGKRNLCVLLWIHHTISCHDWYYIGGGK